MSKITNVVHLSMIPFLLQLKSLKIQIHGKQYSMFCDGTMTAIVDHLPH